MISRILRLSDLRFLKFAFAQLLSLVLCALLPFTAGATDAPLAGDAHISSAHPSTNFGSLTNLHVGNGNIALVQFDLSTLPAGTVAGEIARAILILFVNRVNTAGAVDLHPVTGSWAENTVTFNTAPARGAAIATIPISQVENFVLVDVTSLVQSWVTTPGSNHGIALLASTTAPTTYVLVDSEENDQTGHPPRLDISLSGPQGLQGATGATGAQGIQGLTG